MTREPVEAGGKKNDAFLRFSSLSSCSAGSGLEGRGWRPGGRREAFTRGGAPVSSSGAQQGEGRAVVSFGSRGGESSAEPLDEGEKPSGPLAEGAQAGGNEKGTPSRERDGPAFPDVGTKCGLREVMQVTQDHTARSSNASRDYTITLTPGDTGALKALFPPAG